MQINGSLYYTRISPRFAAYSPPATSGPTAAVDAEAAADRAARVDALSRASELSAALADLNDRLATTMTRRARGALTASAFRLELGGGALTAAVLSSTEEVNMTPTSFTPFGPDYDAPSVSVAPPTIDGVYDGSNGSGTVTFEARKTGVHGTDNLRFRVRDPNGAIIDNIQVRANHAIDREYTLSNGLIFTLGDGFVKKGDTFSVDVFANVGSVVDPTKAFNGVRNDNPNLEYGLSVTDGAFDLNGTSIAVNASDSINDVLARIDASAAGVSATFDAGLEQIVLTQKSLGSAFDITLANDTSGFLAATKLDTATAVPGSDGNANTQIALLPQFAAVTNGALRINGVDIAVSVGTDSLSDILTHIEASAANVSASLVNNRVYLRANDSTSEMTLDDNNTGLLAAIGIRGGRHDPVAAGRLGAGDAREIAASIVAATDALERFFRGENAGLALPADFKQLQHNVSSALQAAKSALENGEVPRFGISFDFDSLTAAPETELSVDKLEHTLRLNFSELRATFLGDEADARQGFVREVLDLVNSFTERVRGEFGTTGLALDLFI